MGEELESAPTSGSQRESREDLITKEPPQPGGVHDLLKSEFATAMRIRGFLEKGARQADAARQEFDKEIRDFRAEREDLHEDMRLLHADRVEPGVLKVWWRTALPRDSGRLMPICWEWSPHWLRSGMCNSPRWLDLLSSTHHVVRNWMNYMRQYPLNTQCL